VWSQKKFFFFCFLYYGIVAVAVVGAYFVSKYWLPRDWLIQAVVLTLIGSLLGIDRYFLVFNYEKYKEDYMNTYGKVEEEKKMKGTSKGAG
jgi:nucleoside permease NupC